MQTLNIHRKALFFYSDPALEMLFKGTATCTLKKILLSTEQWEDPTYHLQSVSNKFAEEKA